MAFRYSIKIWQENEDNLKQLSSNNQHDVFDIDLEFRYNSSLNGETTLETFNQSIVCRRDMFLSQGNGRNIIVSTVANSGACQEFIETLIVPAILSSARDMNSKPMNLGRKVLKMNVEVDIDNEIDDELIDESLMNKMNFKAASRSSIEGLKRVKWDKDDKEYRLLLKKRRKLVEGLSLKKECSICLEELVNGDKVASMPCGHGYHDGCIVKWLQTSHLCPLCRYQMLS